MKKTTRKKAIWQIASAEYGGLIGGIADLLEAARRSAARTVNALMTATYWEIGRRIVEFEQGGEKRAEYGEALLQRLVQDLNAKFGRAFSYPNVNKFRQFYLAFPSANTLSTPSIESTESILSTPSIELGRQKSQTPSGQLALRDLSARFGWTNSAVYLSSKQHTRQASDPVMLKCGGFFFSHSFFEKMRGYISVNGSVDREHLEADNVLGPMYKAFADRLWSLMDELNLTLAA